jgi:hypothetical protein
MGINKEEMHHPQKHIIIMERMRCGKKEAVPVMIDFERCSFRDKQKNVTQYLEYVCRLGKILREKGILVDAEEVRRFSVKYKKKGKLDGKDSYSAVAENLKKEFDKLLIIDQLKIVQLSAVSEFRSAWKYKLMRL